MKPIYHNIGFQKSQDDAIKAAVEAQKPNRVHPYTYSDFVREACAQMLKNTQSS